MVDAVGTTALHLRRCGADPERRRPLGQRHRELHYHNRLRTGLSLQAPTPRPGRRATPTTPPRRLTTLTSPAGSFGYTLRRSSLHAPALLTLPNGASIANAYDSVARLQSTRRLNSSSYATLNSHAYAYNLAGQRTEQVFAAGNYINYTYDNIGPTEDRPRQGVGRHPNRLQEQFGYAYDAAGNLNYRTNNAPAGDLQRSTPPTN